MSAALRRVPWWLVALLVSSVLVATGALPSADARALAERTLPVLAFLAALTVVAEMCAGAGLFDAAAGLAARAARGRRPVLWLLVVVVATVSTAVLSLDTTAVLVTPVVVALARRTGSRPLPFALVVLALANTASLLLPVSNLTNLLADRTLRRQGVDFLALMAVPALVAVLVTVLLVALRDRAAIAGRFDLAPGPVPADRALLVVAAVVTAAMAAAFVAGVEPFLAAGVAAVVLVVATRLRRRPWPVPPAQLVPWRTLLVVAGLFVVVATLHAQGSAALLHAAAGDGSDPGALLRLAAVGVLAANAVNNLPAYLALEPVAGADPLRVAVLLVATGAGPLMTPWGSLATVLWWQRCRQVLLHVPVGVVVRQGLLLCAPVVLAAVAALVLTT
ncbi:SLC13 family permease [Cellulomonas oligotrophica]|uniref:Arsenic transporter n=1 Tax=Cellulomonas oligotrophica TaxID=931536 RepID=A0A7Y9JXE8_9CELL|nr:SLC13 family permease [Cellulomonas oligotrophica]NYD84634.1 arsenical pump membrane protein [Cellulomonas oligotrophica]GIG31701.1 arsenic transporter [Cellulomonas oligotrophica]